MLTREEILERLRELCRGWSKEEEVLGREPYRCEHSEGLLDATRMDRESVEKLLETADAPGDAPQEEPNDAHRR